jgi:hypothetical protein
MPNQIPPFVEIPSRPNGSMPAGSVPPSPPPNGSQQRLALDNLIRRELNVGDPSDPLQIAQGLLSRYQNEPRARAIEQEAQGLPFLPAARSLTPMTAAPTSSDNELALAMADVEKGLTDLTTNPLLKDVTPEIQGWADAVRSAIQTGSTAARFALDASQRDKVFSMRRTLGDYARMARLVGALTPGMNPNYRAFAQSLDEASAVILVMTGDALSSVGLNRGRFLLQAPYTELQTRRDAVIYALRNLTGATQQAYDQFNWPRGLEAYRRLYDVLERQGQGALRSLLVETELARMMDTLIHRAANGTADGLRALGSTAQLDLDQFRRLVMIGRTAIYPPEPPATAFFDALLLFVEAFTDAGGFRLVRIARPPILFYGLYGTEPGDDEHALLQLTIQRGFLADALDVFMRFNRTSQTLHNQIVLDKILYDVDRAIDLYALGKDRFGPPERRAAAYGFLIQAFLTLYPAEVPPPPSLPPNLLNILTKISSVLCPMIRPQDREVSQVAKQLLHLAAIPSLAAQLTSLASTTDISTLATASGGHAAFPLSDLTTVFKDVQQALRHLHVAGRPSIPHDIEAYLGIIGEELVIQLKTEERWKLLVETMATEEVPPTLFHAVPAVIDAAIDNLLGGHVEGLEFRIPPQFETSLEEIADRVRRIA